MTTSPSEIETIICSNAEGTRFWVERPECEACGERHRDAFEKPARRSKVWISADRKTARSTKA